MPNGANFRLFLMSYFYTDISYTIKRRVDVFICLPVRIALGTPHEPLNAGT